MNGNILATNSTGAIMHPETLTGDMLKGVKAISDFLGLPERQVFHLCATSQLPGVFRLGRLWHARKSVLLEGLRRKERGDA